MFKHKKLIFALVTMLVANTSFAALAGTGEFSESFEVKTEVSGAQVGAPYYTFCDDSKEEFEIGQKVIVNMPVDVQESPYMVMLAALYSQDGIIKAITCDDSIEEGLLQAELTMPDGTLNTDKLRIYVWDSVIPDITYCENFTYPYETHRELEWSLASGWLVTSDDKASGLSSLKYSGLTDGEASYVFDTEQYTNYNLSFKYKGTVNLVVTDESDDTVLLDEECTESEEWTEASFTFKSGTAIDIKVSLVGIKDKMAWIDDANLTIKPPVNLLEGGNVGINFAGAYSFEKPGLFAAKTGNIEVYSGDAHTGNNSYKLNATTSDNAMCEAYWYTGNGYASNLVQGKKYVLSFYMKQIAGEVSSDAYSVFLRGEKFKFADATNKIVLGIGRQAKLNEWVKVSLECELTGTVANGTYFVLCTGTTTPANVYLFDDFCIEEIE